MRHIAIILALCALTAADLSADGHRGSPWAEEEDTRERRPLSKWLPSVLGPKDGEVDESDPPAPEPAVADPDPAPRKQRARKRAPEPEPEPEPKLTPEQQEAEDRWWKETGDPAVAVFSRCLGEHVVDETSSGSQSSYPDFVTSAMNSRCAREFAAMAKVILDRHGEDDFARIARKLIATRFVPAVKQVVEGGAPEALPPEDNKLTLEADLRQSKVAMMGCITEEADRMAASSTAEPERLADRVITSCQTSADAYFGTLEQLYPGALGGNTSQRSAAILDESYRPYIVQRIAEKRAGGMAGSVARGKADAEARPSGPALRSSEPATTQPVPTQSVSPAGEPAPASAVPASSRP